jgi:hypothetical protein
MHGPHESAGIRNVPVPVLTSSPTGQDIPEQSSFYGITSHPPDPLGSPVSLNPAFPADQYSSPIFHATFQHDVNLASSGIQQYSHFQYSDVSAYPESANGHGYFEPQAYDQTNHQSQGHLNDDYINYAAFPYQNPYDQ